MAGAPRPRLESKERRQRGFWVLLLGSSSTRGTSNDAGTRLPRGSTRRRDDPSGAARSPRAGSAKHDRRLHATARSGRARGPDPNLGGHSEIPGGRSRRHEDFRELDRAHPLPTPTPTDDELAGKEGFVGRPEPGQTLFGRYRVEKMIGEGGMGSVWLVRHLELDALRALKLIVANNAFNPEAQARFRREARVMARLSHPNAVVVHDARITRGAAFIEMEYIRGESLNRLLKPGVPMPLDWTARILVQLSDVLQEAHDHKIVHRDLKPSNLMLVEGRPPGKEFLKVLDFGIAKILEPDQEGDLHTMTGSFMGTAQYSSPEQASGEAIDGRSDLYSVGVILYEFLTGRRPFEGPLSRQLYDHLHTPPPSFAVRNPVVTVPPAVERVVLRCLAKNPADRPQTAHALAKEFLQVLAEGPGADWPAGAIPREGALRPEASPPPRTESPYSPYVPVEPSPSQAAVTDDADRVGYQPDSIRLDREAGDVLPDPARPIGPPSQEGARQRSRDRIPAGPAGSASSPEGPLEGDRPGVGLAGIALVAARFLMPRPSVHRLPTGYAAEKSDDLVNGWPRTIVRVADESDEESPVHPDRGGDVFHGRRGGPARPSPRGACRTPAPGEGGRQDTSPFGAEILRERVRRRSARAPRATLRFLSARARGHKPRDEGVFSSAEDPEGNAARGAGAPRTRRSTKPGVIRTSIRPWGFPARWRKTSPARSAASCRPRPSGSTPRARGGNFILTSGGPSTSRQKEREPRQHGDGANRQHLHVRGWPVSQRSDRARNLRFDGERPRVVSRPLGPLP